MGQRANATIFFGMKPLDDEDNESRDFDGDEAIEAAAGCPPDAPYEVRRAFRDSAPVDFVCTGYEGDALYALAIKTSVLRAFEWSVVAIKPQVIEQDPETMTAQIHEWADKLGIPKERRGAIGWHFFATYG